MRFLIDAQLPPGLADLLRANGHAAEHVNLIDLGAATDREIWDYAIRLGSVIISKDEDFVDLVRAGNKGPAVVWIRLGNTTNRVLNDVIARALPEILEGLSLGERLVEIT
ncbi:MAG TPA: DUF5615 family PIN-like protein [Bauldia sp.]|nr:DUF5615 family PIN-like protein [Bauldia sp.]